MRIVKRQHVCRMHNMETLGPLVRMTRERKGIRAADLAYHIGKDPSYLSRLERDLLKDLPTPDVLVALARELDIPETRLLRALGFLQGDQPLRPTYGDTRLQAIADDWDHLNDAEKAAMMIILEGNRRRRGFDGLDDIVQIVTQSGGDERALG
jgi:transcriptional regulator with XRE-family HTH domain